MSSYNSLVNGLRVHKPCNAAIYAYELGLEGTATLMRSFSAAVVVDFCDFKFSVLTIVKLVQDPW
eukprot:1330626-Amphidinium_carterae.1